MAFKMMLSKGPLRVFSKWCGPDGRYGMRNHGNITKLANEWFATQGALEDNTPYDSGTACSRGLAAGDPRSVPRRFRDSR